jgi:hypothetical protein
MKALESDLTSRGLTSVWVTRRKKVFYIIAGRL